MSDNAGASVLMSADLLLCLIEQCDFPTVKSLSSAHAAQG